MTFLSLSNYVLALTDRGEVRIIKATGGGYEQVTSYQVSQTPTWAPPVLLPDGILIKDLNTLTFWSFSKPSLRQQSVR